MCECVYVCGYASVCMCRWGGYYLKVHNHASGKPMHAPGNLY